MNGVIYARFSAGPNQTHKSIEGQVRDCTTYAEQKGIRIVNTYIDEAISGKDFEGRAAFQKMMRDAQKKAFDCVIVWKIDRLGRNREELAISKARLKRCGVHVHYAMEHIPEGPEGIILESLMEGLAEYYSAELAQKVSRGMRDTILSGKTINGKPCFGYLIKDRKFVPDPDRAPYVPEIFGRYAKGESPKKICEDFTRRGIKTSAGNDLTPKTLYKMLRNIKYTGLYIYGDIRIPDFHQRLISDELFEEVARVMRSKSNGRGRRSRSNDADYILSGKLFCGKCKNKMTGESGTGRHNKEYHYYKCHGRKNRKTGCTMEIFRKEELEEIVIKATQQSVLTDEVIDYLVEHVMELQESGEENLAIRSIERNIKDVSGKIKNIMNAIEVGIVTPTTKDRLMELESEKDRLSVELAKTRAKKTAYTEDEVRFYLESFRDGEADNEDFAKTLISIFVNSIYIYDDYLVMFYNFAGGAEESQNFAELADKAVEMQKNKGNVSDNVPRTEPYYPLSETSFLFFITLSAFGAAVHRSLYLSV